VPMKTLYQWHQSGKGPSAVRVGRLAFSSGLRGPLVAGRPAINFTRYPVDVNDDEQNSTPSAFSVRVGRGVAPAG
jgi:hypothetical protein